MTAILVIGIVSLICLSAMCILVAVTFRKALSDAFRALNVIELRSQRQLDTVLDRLMTIKWEDYAVVRTTNDDDEGGFIVPGEDDEEDELKVDDGKWGHLSNLRERLRLSDDEQALVDEDFDEQGSPRRF